MVAIVRADTARAVMGAGSEGARAIAVRVHPGIALVGQAGGMRTSGGSRGMIASGVTMIGMMAAWHRPPGYVRPLGGRSTGMARVAMVIAMVI